MKHLFEYLVNDHTKFSDGNIFDNNRYHWIGRKMPKSELNACKQKIHKYIVGQFESYPTVREYTEKYKELLERFYMQYLQSEGSTMPDNAAQKTLDKVIKVIDEIGIHAQYTVVGQGWFHALSFLIDKKII